MTLDAAAIDRLRHHAQLFARVWLEEDPGLPFADPAFRGEFWAVLLTLVADESVVATALTSEPLVAMYTTLAAMSFLDREADRAAVFQRLNRRPVRHLRLAA